MTARQVEQRKLASKLRSITGVRGNMRSLWWSSSEGDRFLLAKADEPLKLLEQKIRADMGTISARIPADPDKAKPEHV